MKKFLFLLLWLLTISSTLFIPDKSFAQSVVGVNTWAECLMWMWKDCFVYQGIVGTGIDAQKRSAKNVAQDVVMAATYMVGTVLTIVLLYCWLMYILSARSWKDPSKYKDWLINAWIWALLVWWAYAIVRLIQYIAKW